MKKIILIVLLLLSSIAFANMHESNYYGTHSSDGLILFSAGYSQEFSSNSPTIDLNLITLSFFPFDFYDLEIGVDFLHFQVSMVDRIQSVSDETLWCFIHYFGYIVPFAVGFANGYSSLIDVTRAIFMGVNFAWHGQLYFPVLPQRWLGLVNKHRFVTEIITKGWHKKSFTFQDDLGIRFDILLKKEEELKKEGVYNYYKLFIDTGVRFEKTFDRDWNLKLFLQTGYRSL